MSLIPCETCGKQLSVNMRDDEVCPNCRNPDPHGNKRRAFYFKVGLVSAGVAIAALYYLYRQFGI